MKLFDIGGNIVSGYQERNKVKLESGLQIVEAKTEVTIDKLKTAQ